MIDYLTAALNKAGGILPLEDIWLVEFYLYHTFKSVPKIMTKQSCFKAIARAIRKLTSVQEKIYLLYKVKS